MDNVSHSLAGAALGYAGLKRKTGLGLAALIIAANIPDVDGVAMLIGRTLTWRRGWTHGPLAMLLFPPLVAAALYRFDRWQARRGRRPAARAPVRFGPLLLLAYIGALSHPVLDLLNTYGLRFLMPFSDRWFYGDSLFIVDPWLWGVLAAGVGISVYRYRRDLPRPGLPAVASVVCGCAYIALMAAASLQAEAITARAVAGRGLGIVDDVVANPGPFNPLERRMVFRVGDRYGFGTVRFRPAPHIEIAPRVLAGNMDNEAVARAARADPRMADFLYWSRLPLATIAADGDGLIVSVWDARYGDSLDDARFRHMTRLAGPGAPAAR